VETPASAAIFLEVILSPIASMAWGGPMKAMPAFSSASAKAWRVLRQEAVARMHRLAPVALQASMILSITM
jgi:hypothetical protein